MIGNSEKSLIIGGGEGCGIWLDGYDSILTAKDSSAEACVAFLSPPQQRAVAGVIQLLFHLPQ